MHNGAFWPFDDSRLKTVLCWIEICACCHTRTKVGKGCLMQPCMMVHGAAGKILWGLPTCYVSSLNDQHLDICQDAS